MFFLRKVGQQLKSFFNKLNKGESNYSEVQKRKEEMLLKYRAYPSFQGMFLWEKYF